MKKTRIIALAGLAVLLGGGIADLAIGGHPTTTTTSTGRPGPAGGRPVPTHAAAQASTKRPTTATKTPHDLSGAVMPTGNLPGWTLVSSDNFDGGAVDTRRWQEYLGAPRDDPAGFFDPTHIRVADGELVESTYRDPKDGDRLTSAGMKSFVSQRYGKYEVRFRFSRGSGVAHDLLLWPSDNTWPPEVDFSEDDGAATRAINYGVLRYGRANATRQVQVRVDLSTWHTFGVEWTPGTLRYTLDGRVWATQTGADVPSIPMRMAIQAQAWSCAGRGAVACPTVSAPGVVDLDVDWAVQYAYTPAVRG